MDGFSSRKITRVLSRVKIDHFIISDPGAFQGLFTRSGYRDGHSEYAANCCSLNAAKDGIAPANYIRRDTALPVGGTGGLRASNGNDAWLRRRSARLLSCLPASGADLPRLAGQLGLEFA